MTKNRTGHEWQKSLAHFAAKDQFGALLGYKGAPLKQGSGKATTSLVIRQTHLSPAGRVHGGVISAFFDFACGAAVFTVLGPQDFCATIELKVNYLYPIELGQKLTAKTGIVFEGRRLAVVHGYIYRAGFKNPVAMCTSTFNVVRDSVAQRRTKPAKA